MHITLHPRFQAEGEKDNLPPLRLVRGGSVLQVNGQEFDFAVLGNGEVLPDGARATGCDHFAGQIERDDEGKLKLELYLPCAIDAPESARFPQPIIDPPDGPIDLPQTNWPPAPEQTEQGGEDASD